MTELGYLVENDVIDAEPITVSEFKQFAKFDIADEDELIDMFISTARFNIEKYIKRSLIERSFTLYLDDFPTDDTILLPRSPVVSVTSIQYKGQDGNWQTFSASYYEVDNVREPSRIRLKDGNSWASVGDYLNAVKVNFEAGYGADSSDIPSQIKLVLMHYVAHLFQNREPDQNESMPHSVRTALMNHKVR